MSSASKLTASFLLALGMLQAQSDPACSDAVENFSKAQGLLSQKQYDEAAQVLNVLQGCSKLSPFEKFQLGWLLGRARKFEAALNVFRQVPHDVPDRATHDYAMALSEFELSRYADVIQQFKTERDENTLDENAANLIAVAYSKQGDYQSAYKLLSERIEQNQSSLETYLNLATVCAEGGDYPSAAKAASDAVRLFPKSPEPYLSRGAASTLLGKTGPAFEDFARAAKLAPQRSDARFFMALAKYKDGQFREAEDILERAIAEGLRDSDLHYLLAECLIKVEKTGTDAALKELSIALDLNPESEAARTLRGKVLLETGRAQEAIPDLEAALHENPKSRSATYALARAYKAVGNEAGAKELFAKVRKQPESTIDEVSAARLTGVLSPAARVKAQ